ncbi:MAG: alpha/beta fold hydrolase [Actinomycetes bacterium]
MRKKISLLAVSALASIAFTAMPTVARAADPACATVSFVTTCQGATSDGAAYVMQVPANFNGTLMLYSHGYRYPVDIPAGIPVVGGYKVVKLPQQGPDAVVIGTLLGKGYAVAGSAFPIQGWNAGAGVAADVELIGLFRKQFPATKKVAAWGSSLGGFITQALAEQHPELIDAAAPMCPAIGSVEAELTMAGDVLWGMKTFFDPTIKAHNYSAGAAGYGEAMGDLVKVFTVLGKLQGAIASGVWPDSSGPAGTALASIPPRSALLMVGLLAGLPTQSAHFDSTSGPGSPNTAAYTSFALAASPALAILENVANAAVLGVMATYDVEIQSGGAVFDNSKTDYTARVSSDAAVFNAALSGSDAIGGMLSFLNPANPAAPRWSADAAAVTKMRALTSHTGKINVPTVTLASVADPVTPAGNAQWLADKYAAQYAAEKANALHEFNFTHEYIAPKKNLITIWAPTPSTYTKFTATGAPDTTTPAANGTNHCNYTDAQMLVVADLVGTAATTGVLKSGGPLTTLVRKAKGLTLDPGFRAPLLKFYNEEL